METLRLRSLLTAGLLAVTLMAFVEQSSAIGGANGGGGDSQEMIVDAIRSDIRSWVQAGGPQGFKNWPPGVTLAIYKKSMPALLEPKAVIIGFVTSAQEAKELDAELKVTVKEQPKACRGFFSTADRKAHILCNVERFPIVAAEQYRLIHHEFAGLAGVEQNEGAASDYTLSNQLTSLLQAETVYRLPIQKGYSVCAGLEICVEDKVRTTIQKMLAQQKGIFTKMKVANDATYHFECYSESKESFGDRMKDPDIKLMTVNKENESEMNSSEINYTNEVVASIALPSDCNEGGIVHNWFPRMQFHFIVEEKVTSNRNGNDTSQFRMKLKK